MLSGDTLELHEEGKSGAYAGFCKGGISLAYLTEIIYIFVIKYIVVKTEP